MTLRGKGEINLKSRKINICKDSSIMFSHFVLFLVNGRKDSWKIFYLQLYINY